MTLILFNLLTLLAKNIFNIINYLDIFLEFLQIHFYVNGLVELLFCSGQTFSVTAVTSQPSLRLVISRPGRSQVLLYTHRLYKAAMAHWFEIALPVIKRLGHKGLGHSKSRRKS